MRYMIFDRWGNPLGDLPYAIKAIRTRATDGTDTLDITTIGEINKDERIAFKDSMGRWAEYLCQSTQTARAAGMPVTVAYCTGSIAELSRTYIEDKRNRNANAKACLAKALEGTRWAVGTVETGTLTGTANLAFYHCTALDAIQKTADTYGLEVQTEVQPDPTGNRIGRRIIHLVEHRGSTNTTKRFEYGKDLTQIKRDIDSGDVIPRLYGWGKGIEQTNDQGEATGGYSRKISFADVNNGKPYVQDDQALANWGIPGPDGTRHHSEASVDFPDCEDPKELLNLTKAALKTRTTPVVSYTADVTALGQAGYSAEGTDVGDSVQIIDTSFTTPLRLEGRILQIEEDLAGSLADTKITLGNIRQSYTQRRRHRPVHEGPHRPHQPDHERDRRIRLPDAQPRHLRVRQADRPAPHAGHPDRRRILAVRKLEERERRLELAQPRERQGHLRRRDLHRPALRCRRLQQLEPRHRRLQTLRTDDGRRKNGRRDRRRLIVGSARRGEEVRRPDEA